MINDPHEGHLESANPIREFKEKKRRDQRVRFRTCFSVEYAERDFVSSPTNHPELNRLLMLC